MPTALAVAWSEALPYLIALLRACLKISTDLGVKLKLSLQFWTVQL